MPAVRSKCPARDQASQYPAAAAPTPRPPYRICSPKTPSICPTTPSMIRYPSKRRTPHISKLYRHAAANALTETQYKVALACLHQITNSGYSCHLIVAPFRQPFSRTNSVDHRHASARPPCPVQRAEPLYCQAHPFPRINAFLAVVVVDVAQQDAFEMALSQNNHVVQTFPAYGADDPFAYGFCQGNGGVVVTSLIPSAVNCRRYVFT